MLRRARTKSGVSGTKIASPMPASTPAMKMSSMGSVDMGGGRVANVVATSRLRAALHEPEAGARRPSP